MDPRGGDEPGKPQGFGVVGEDETPIFTLPGNPVRPRRVEMFVAGAGPAGRRGRVRDADDGPAHRAGALDAGRVPLLRARVDLDADGLRATPVGGAGVTDRRPGPLRRPDRPGRGRHPRRHRRTGARAPPGRAVMSEFTHLDESGAARTVDVRARTSPPDRPPPRAACRLGRGRQPAAWGGRAQGRRAGRVAGRRDHGRRAHARLLPLCHPSVIHGDEGPERRGGRGGHHRHRAHDRRHRCRMEALTAVSVVVLTLVDWRSRRQGRCHHRCRVEEKTGGKSGTDRR